MRFWIWLYLPFFFLLMIGEGWASLYPVRDLSEAGNVALEQRDYEAAIEFFGEAYERDSKNIIAIYNFANAYHYAGEYSKSAERYQEAIDLAIKRGEKDILPSLYYNLANTYYKKQDFGKAVESYKLAMDEDEDDLQIKKNYELAFQKLEENKGAQPDPPQDNRDQQNSQNNQNNQQQGQEQDPSSDNQDKGNQGDQDRQERNDRQNQADQNGQSDSKLEQKSEQGDDSDQGKPSQNNGDTSTGSGENPSTTISLERAEQILNSYQNRQKKFESFRKYKQNISPKPNSKNW